MGVVLIEGERRGSPNDPLVLLVPGTGQTRALWRGVAADLVDPGQQVISVDLPGHGGSERAAEGNCSFAPLSAICARSSRSSTRGP